MQEAEGKVIADLRTLPVDPPGKRYHFLLCQRPDILAERFNHTADIISLIPQQELPDGIPVPGFYVLDKFIQAPADDAGAVAAVCPAFLAKGKPMN